MSPDQLQAQVAELQRAVSQLQRQNGLGQQGQLTTPLDPMSEKIILDLIPAAASGITGYVTSGGGTGTPFPSGWSVVHHGTGDFSVIHNHGAADYAVNVTPVGTQCVPCVVFRNPNDFRVTLVTPSSAFAVNSDFMFTFNA